MNNSSSDSLRILSVGLQCRVATNSDGRFENRPPQKPQERQTRPSLYLDTPWTRDEADAPVFSLVGEDHRYSSLLFCPTQNRMKLFVCQKLLANS